MNPNQCLRGVWPILLMASFFLVSCGSALDSQDNETSHQLAGDTFTIRHSWSFYLAVDPFQSVREKRNRELAKELRQKGEKKILGRERMQQRIDRLAKEFQAKVDEWKKKHLGSDPFQKTFFTFHNKYVQIRNEAIPELIAGHRVESTPALKAQVENLSIQPDTIHWTRGKVSTSVKGMEITATVRVVSPVNAAPKAHFMRLVFPKLESFCKELECVFRKDSWRRVSVGILKVQLHPSRFSALRAQGDVLWTRYKLYIIGISMLVLALCLKIWFGMKREVE